MIGNLLTLLISAAAVLFNGEMAKRYPEHGLIWAIAATLWSINAGLALYRIISCRTN